MRLFVILVSAFLVLSCGEAPKPTPPPSNVSASPTVTPQQELTAVDRPAKIADQVSMRGEQDAALPTLTIVEPKANAALTSSTVKVQLTLAGDLKGYEPHMDEATKMGNHIHVILDNQPYEAYYNLGQPFELRNVMDGEHILRVFPSRPWHESYKNEGGFQAIKFSVKNGGADPSKPATTGGQPMSGPTPEGKDVKPSNSGKVDLKKPLLTYSRPKGEYKGADAAAIMIDFWLTNAKLTGDGGEYRVKYTLNGGEPKFIDKWAPIWLSGWLPGTHDLMLELVDKDGNLVDNGGYNQTTREITVAK